MALKNKTKQKMQLYILLVQVKMTSDLGIRTVGKVYKRFVLSHLEYISAL